MTASPWSRATSSWSFRYSSCRVKWIFSKSTRRLVRRSPQVLDRDVLDRDVDVVAVSGEEGLDDPALAVRLDGRVGEPSVQEVERRRIVLPGRPLAPTPSERSGGLYLSVASINRYGPLPAYISCRYNVNVTIP